MSAVDFFNNDVELPFLQRLCGSKTKRAAALPGGSSLKLQHGNDSSTRDRCYGLCRGDYARPGAVGPEILVSGLVASIFLAFFKVFLAMDVTSSEFGPSSTATRAATGRATALANRNSSAPHGWGHSQGRAEDQRNLRAGHAALIRQGLRRFQLFRLLQGLLRHVFLRRYSDFRA